MMMVHLSLHKFLLGLLKASDCFTSQCSPIAHLGLDNFRSGVLDALCKGPCFLRAHIHSGRCLRPHAVISQWAAILCPSCGCCHCLS